MLKSLSILFILSIFILPISAQDDALYCYPFDNKQYDTVQVDSLVVRYKTIQTRSAFEDGKMSLMSELILPDYDNESDKLLMQKIMDGIGAINHSNELAAFTTCKARDLYYSCKDLLPLEADYFDAHFIGYFKVNR